MKATYTQRQLERCRRCLDFVTFGDPPVQVVYDWCVTGPRGAHFTLLREPHHTAQDMVTAKVLLRRQQDVVSIAVAVPNTVEIESIDDNDGAGPRRLSRPIRCF